MYIGMPLYATRMKLGIAASFSAPFTGLRPRDSGGLDQAFQAWVACSCSSCQHASARFKGALA